MTNYATEFGNRLSMFQEGYEFEECNGLVRPLMIIGEMLDITFNPFVSARAMEALRLIISTAPEEKIDWMKLPTSSPTDGWREEWKDIDAYNDTYWPEAMERAHNLNAFAFYGIIPNWSGLVFGEEISLNLAETLDVPKYIESTVYTLTQYTAMFNKQRDYLGINAIEATCLAATGRLKLDQGKAITVHELAALTNVTTKRLQNAIYAKSEDAPIVGKGGQISAASAQRWLKARDYLPSIWKEFIEGRYWEQLGSDSSVDMAGDEDLRLEEYLFVPEAKDGTIFGPISCQRAGQRDDSPHFTIGRKGKEQNFQSYYDALEVLATMPIPRWRRPNENGNFGIVTAERWRRVSRNELNSL